MVQTAVRWQPTQGPPRAAVFLAAPFDDAIAFLNGGLLAAGKVLDVELLAVWPGYAFDCAVPDQDPDSVSGSFQAYTINALRGLTVRAVNPVPPDVDSVLQVMNDKPIELPAVEGDTNYALHKFGLALRYPQQVAPAPGNGPQTLSWVSDLRTLDAADLEVNARMNNLNDSRINQQICLPGVAPTGRAAAPLLEADLEAILVELPAGYVAFHTATGLQAWMVAQYGSYAAAPIVRVGWVYHEAQLDRLGLAFGTNLAWGD